MKEKTAQNFFSKEEQNKIVSAIQKAEKLTSSEIRLHIDTQSELAPLDRTAYLFKHLKMHKTTARNGVLLYLSIKDRQFAIIGDAGIHCHVKDAFWERCKEGVLAQFKAGNYCKGITDCIELVGSALQKHFPYQDDDQNELPDEISFN